MSKRKVKVFVLISSPNLGYSWLAMQYDLTGALSSLSFLGSNGGWLVIPPVAGRVGRVAGTTGILYLTTGIILYIIIVTFYSIIILYYTGLTAAHVLLFLAMQAAVSSKKKLHSNDTIEDNTNKTHDTQKT